MRPGAMAQSSTPTIPPMMQFSRTCARTPRIEFVDNVRQQQAGLQELRPPPPSDVTAEPTRWAYYPWRRAVVRILGPRAFRLVRLDRNRNLITAAELDRLARLRIGVVGLSVGHAIAYTLAAQGLCGELRLTDFDDLELSNLNRVPASVFDLGVNKAAVCARRIAELDPYLPVTVMPAGITPQTVDEFVDGLDIVIEECDSLDAKVLIREVARARRVPVLMATSDRGLWTWSGSTSSRPARSCTVCSATWIPPDSPNLSNEDKLPYALRMADASQVSSRMAASLVEVGKTLSTWPQLSSEVALNASVDRRGRPTHRTEREFALRQGADRHRSHARRARRAGRGAACSSVERRADRTGRAGRHLRGRRRRCYPRTLGWKCPALAYRGTRWFGERAAGARALDDDGCRIPSECSGGGSGHLQRPGRRRCARIDREGGLSARG